MTRRISSRGRWGRVLALIGCLAWTSLPPAAAQGTAGARSSEPPSVIPASVGEMAAPYRTLVRDMASLSELSFRSPEDIALATKLIETYDPQAVARGWFAHHAIIAANHPVFFAAVRKQARYMGRRRFIRWMTEDRARLRDAPGHDAAVQQVLDAVNAETRHMAAMGNLLLARALDLQSERLGDEALFSQVTAENGAMLAADYDLGGRYTPRTLSPKAREPVDRVLEIAARLSLGATDARGYSRILTVASERRMEYCVTQAKLNFRQCTAATRHDEERAFCVGRHGIEELGGCWRWMLEDR